MSSIQSTLYYFLADLEALLNANSEIKFIDLYHGQDNRPEKEQSFDRPAVLIEFEDIDWDTTYHKIGQANFQYEKKGMLRFNLHLWFRTYDKEINRFKESDLFRQALDKSIEGLQNQESYNPVKKVGERQETNDSLQWKWIITYEVMLQEEGVTRNLIGKTGVAPVINASI